MSYVGSFTKQYRQELVDCRWLPFLQREVSPVPYRASLREHHVEIPAVKAVCTQALRASGTATAWKLWCEGHVSCVL